MAAIATRRQRLDEATQRQKARYPRLTWKEARRLARTWCEAMWPREFIEETEDEKQHAEPVEEKSAEQT